MQHAAQAKALAARRAYDKGTDTKGAGSNETARPAPGAGCSQAKRRVAAVPAARAARPPAVARRAREPAARSLPGFEGGQLPLMQSMPKLKGFTNPFPCRVRACEPPHPSGFEGDVATPKTLADGGPGRGRERSESAGQR